MHGRRVILTLLFLVPAAAEAQQPRLPPEVRAAADGITAAQLARDVEYLSSDALFGRNTPSPGFDSAAACIARRLERAGVKPLGDGGTYFQHYELREERIDTTGAYLEVGGRTFRFGEHFVMGSFAGPVSGTLPVVYVGHGWVVPEAGIDPYRDVDVRGKLVLAESADPPPELGIRRIGRVYVNGSSPLVEAARRGAAGVLFVAGPEAIAGWDRLRRMNLARLEMHPVVPSAYAAAPITSLLLGEEAARALLGDALTGAGGRTGQAAEATSRELGSRVTIRIPLAERTVHRPYNVVAMIEGSDPVLRNEYITVASHLDGAVGDQVVDGDGIYNAADDNATGSAANLAIAEQLMRAPRPKRSIIFIWDSGEERGLWGTRHFVHSSPVPLENIVAHINIDMIGANRAPGFADSASAGVTGPNEVYLIGPGVLSERADSLLERVNRSYLGMRFNREFDRPDHEFFYPRTDAGPFLERGVLTIGFFTGLHDRYHLPADEARYLDPAKMETVARTIFAALWALADAEERPGIDKEIPPAVPRYR
ncbi:MAG TPA: M28 family peptidase [Longimicrobiales bacterium]|nr:M28 family peptidase [Longimicrobiales bacterium]